MRPAAFAVVAFVKPDEAVLEGDRVIVCLDDSVNNAEGVESVLRSAIAVGITLVVMAEHKTGAIDASKSYCHLMGFEILEACVVSDRPVSRCYLPPKEQWQDGMVGRYEPTILLGSSTDDARKQAEMFVADVLTAAA